MYKHLGTFVSRYWVLVILAWGAVWYVGHRTAPVWDDVCHDGDLAYLPDRMTSVRGAAVLAQAFPENKAKSEIVVVLERPNKPFKDRSDPDLEVLDRIVRHFSVDGDVGLPPLLAWTQGAQNAVFQPRYTQRPVVAVLTPRSQTFLGNKLLSPDRQAAVAVLQLSNELAAVGNMELFREVRQVIDEVTAASDFPADMRVGVTGSAALGADMLAAAESSIQNTEITTVMLVLIILAVVYRAPVLVIIPLATIGFSVLVATDLVALLTQAHLLPGLEWFDFKVFKTSKIFIVTILFGSGTDFCLFLIARYREEMERGLPRDQALAAAIGNVGDAITASAMTTIFGLGMMYFADFGKFSNSGPAIGMCLAVALLACLTLAPAMLRLFGKVVFWPWGIQTSAAGPRDEFDAAAADNFSHRLWNRLSKAIVARPGVILIASVLVLSPLAYLGRSVEVSYNLLAELGDDRPSVHGTNMFRSHFPPGELGPITVLVQRQRAPLADSLAERLRAAIAVDAYRLAEPHAEVPIWADDLATVLKSMAVAEGAQPVHPATSLFDTSVGRNNVQYLTKALYGHSAVGLAADRGGPASSPRSESHHLRHVPMVAAVRSLSEPLGDVPGNYNPFSPAGRQKLAVLRNPRTKATYLSRQDQLTLDVARFDVVLNSDPFSPQAMQAFVDLETGLNKLAADPSSAWYGTRFDFVGVTPGTRDLKAVVDGDERLIQQLVVLAVLAILICLLRRPVICVYLIVSVLFSYYVTLGATELLFSHVYQPYPGLDWKVPIFLFVILVAVGEDYNIYLATRVFEEQARWGPLEGLRVAVERTGGIITSCGVIMAGTFVSMMTGTLKGMLELGFALTLGVMLDTIVVRPVLVPAFLALLYRRQQARLPQTVVYDELEAITEGLSPKSPTLAGDRAKPVLRP